MPIIENAVLDYIGLKNFNATCRRSMAIMLPYSYSKLSSISFQSGKQAK